MDDETKCQQCKRIFANDDGELHPTLDAILCPYCGAINLFPPDSPFTWERLLEEMYDALWSAHHLPDDSD